jgi:hypothetical protein
MNRRDALSRVALLVGGTIVGAEFFLSGCTASEKKAAGLPLSAEDIAYLDEIAETIIPATDTPGAKAAKVGEFMHVMVTDCYDEKNQRLFLGGMDKINAACKKAHGHDFMKATPEQRKEVLTAIDKEAKEHQKKKGDFDAEQAKKASEAQARGEKDFKREEMEGHYFALYKQLTLLGFFTSETGATKTLRYLPVPGRYEGCIPYKKGDKAWAT